MTHGAIIKDISNAVTTASAVLKVMYLKILNAE
jgi:hypothetical protein